nr:lipid-A-disaccharide synthase [Leptolyngbya sp. FACHB-36]
MSNGPGEVTTWVKPVVRSLRQRFGEDRTRVRISVVLSPCANASGQEAAIARRYPEVDRVQGAEHFFPFLLWGKTAEQWDWHRRGVVLFLGGDQFFPVIIGKRLGYRTVVYAEWEARWHRWIDRFGIMQSSIAAEVSQPLAHKFTVVGDLMAEAGSTDTDDPTHDSAFQRSNSTLIGLLPGSKPLKLLPGVPLCLAIADCIYRANPTARFGLAVAPTLTLTELATYANPNHNPSIARFGWGAAELVTTDGSPYLKLPSGLQINLWTEFPAYDRLAQCDLCLTTVGANTAELGSLAVPMLVLLPTQQMELMRAWDGLPGLLAKLPGVGGTIAKTLSKLALKRAGRLAWPNIWAQSEIVPELVGELQPAEVAAIALDYLSHPDKLQAMRARLRSVRGEPGASEKLVQLVWEELAEVASYHAI